MTPIIRRRPVPDHRIRDAMLKWVLKPAGAVALVLGLVGLVYCLALRMGVTPLREPRELADDLRSAIAKATSTTGEP